MSFLRRSCARSLVVLLLATGLTTLLPPPVFARPRSKGVLDSALEAIEDHHSYQIPAAGAIEVAFSPNEGSERLVIKVIQTAQRDIRILSYSFTSVPVTQALLAARHRGVRVTLVADAKNNVSEDRSGKARAALSALVNAGCDVRTISVYPIHHDKVLIVDGQTVELGSFNYSDAAAHRNSENVLVNWHNPQLARIYLDHFARNYAQSRPYETRY
jgi:phosphatidylserine/phosphatidylglycerophosphate/cardiolipin synthase-like enzyme